MEAGCSSWNVKPAGVSRGWSRTASFKRYPFAERGMRLEDLESHLLCRDCRRRQARLEAVPRLPKQAFVGGDDLTLCRGPVIHAIPLFQVKILPQYSHPHWFSFLGTHQYYRGLVKYIIPEKELDNLADPIYAALIWITSEVELADRGEWVTRTLQFLPSVNIIVARFLPNRKP